MAYRACGKATTRAAAALPRRKSDAGGPAFRWPEDEAPETPRPDVAGEDEKSPEDAVALVLFDDGDDGDRVEAAPPDDDEAAAERPDEAASDGECLDDEEIFLDVDVRRADETGATDAEARGAEEAARDDHEAGDADAEERGAAGAAQDDREAGDAAAGRREDAASDRESLDDEDILLDVDARRADGAGAADAVARGAEDAARDDHDAGDAVAGRPGEARSRARGRSATQGEGRSRSGSRSKSRSRSRSRRPGRRAMHRAPYVVKAKGAVVRAGVALDSDKVVKLPAGTAVVVEAAEQLPDKKTRYLLVEPVVGWVSRGAVAKAR